MCGEDAAFEQIVQGHVGSPPHVWGRRPASLPGPGWSRFTPTCVGKTSDRDRSGRPGAVHPHMCGEDGVTASIEFQSVGSPPHVWGRLWYANAPGPPGRFTPTCVGKTSWSLIASACSSVHPHMCGEDVRPNLFFRERSGSPPHVWGRRRRYATQTIRLRFTPTCVGKTSSFRLS